ncbi:MAG: hypothetical protein ABIQ44_01135, partial [Chloroflexia bacterium]
MPGAQYDQVIWAFASDRTKKSLAKRIHFQRFVGYSQFLDACAGYLPQPCLESPIMLPWMKPFDV